MRNLEKNKTLIVNFIETIWNERRFDELDRFLDTDFVDHSLPPTLPANAEGLKLWIIGTGKSFEHKTLIEEQVTEGNKSMIKIRILLKHTGTWREIEATGAEIVTIGYRYFRIAEGRIVGHWALLDGNSIEIQLRASDHGCKMQD